MSWSLAGSSGLDPEQIPLLFEKFTQLGSGRRGGSGLGLVLAQQIAMAFGTGIVVKSPWQENGQEGTSMEIFLHGCVQTAPTEITINLERAVDDFRAARALISILVVEDEQLNRMVICAVTEELFVIADSNLVCSDCTDHAGQA